MKNYSERQILRFIILLVLFPKLLKVNIIVFFASIILTILHKFFCIITGTVRTIWGSNLRSMSHLRTGHILLCLKDFGYLEEAMLDDMDPIGNQMDLYIKLKSKLNIFLKIYICLW